ncbi:helix-turn-helix domain-containing protein [Nonomuraea sp. NPDC049269]|uniref:helix-turn-helix domain-containing protein n=1 Tax=Nonomuraea sp. NPDC049269 TaxID=3364349 RepID=UPI0037161845
MTQVRGHWRRNANGTLSWVRAHSRGAAAAGGAGGILLVIGLFVWGGISNSASNDVRQPQVTVTRSPLSPAHAQLVEALRAARQRSGLSLEGAGRRAGVSAKEVSDIETGLLVPTPDDVTGLSNAYQLSPDEWTSLVILQSSVH